MCVATFFQLCVPILCCDAFTPCSCWADDYLPGFWEYFYFTQGSCISHVLGAGGFLTQAKEMVALADSVTKKLEEKKGSLTEDEVCMWLALGTVLMI